MKAFISHGGLLSTIETIYHGVPILGIPIFGDQKMNLAIAVEKGYAVSLPYGELTEESLEKALKEVLNNPRYIKGIAFFHYARATPSKYPTIKMRSSRYTKNAKARSKLLHDRPMKPLDTAVYWVEYVGRNGKCEHFRSTALDLAWYQRSMFDIVVFLTAVTIILFWVFYYIIKKILGPNKQNVEKKKKKE